MLIGTRWSALTLACLLCMACRESRVLSRAYELRDSVGIEIVYSGVRPPDAVWSLDSVPLLEVGQLSGEAPYVLDRVWDAEWVPEVGLFISDGTAEVRVFDPSGRYVRSIGRRGEGPREFSASPYLAFSPDGHLLTWDPGHGRLSRWNVQGDLVKQEARGAQLVEHGIPPLWGAPVWEVASNGVLLSTVTAEGRHNEFVNRHTRGIITLVDSVRSTDLGIHPRSEVIMARFGFGNPFYPSTQAGLSQEGRVAVSDSVAWEVRVFSVDGRLQRILRAPIRRTPVDDAALASRRADIDKYGELFDVRPNDRDRVERAMFLPDSMPAIRGIWFAPDGGIWAGKRDVQGRTDGFEVFDADGRWIATVEIPGKTPRVLGLGKGVVTTLESDELGVQRVRVRRVQRTGR